MSPVTYIKEVTELVQRRLNMAAITDHANINNCIIYWERAGLIERDSNRGISWIKEAFWIKYICRHTGTHGRLIVIVI